MERTDISEVREAQTCFHLTRDEVIQAVARWLTEAGESIPEGRRMAWIHEGDKHKNWLSMVIDHPKSEAR